MRTFLSYSAAILAAGTLLVQGQNRNPESVTRVVLTLPDGRDFMIPVSDSALRKQAVGIVPIPKADSPASKFHPNFRTARSLSRLSPSWVMQHNLQSGSHARKLVSGRTKSWWGPTI